MSLNKQTLNINFSNGVDLKTDPWQVTPGKFLELENTVFDKGGLLTKRNGFGGLASLPNDDYTTVTTFSEDLVAIGTDLQMYSDDTDQWLNKGTMLPISLSVVPAVRGTTTQTSVDIAVAPNYLACSVFLDSGGLSYYQIIDSHTGQVLVTKTALPSTATFGRVFVLNSNFIITFLATVSAATHLQYIAIPTNNPTSAGVATDISTSVSALTAGYDGLVCNSRLYVALDGNDGGGAIRISYLSSHLVVSAPAIIPGYTSDLMSVTCDMTGATPVIWVSFWNTSDNDCTTVAYSQDLDEVLAPTLTINNTELIALTSTATSQVMTLLYEVSNAYGYTPNARTDYIATVTCTEAGTVGSSSTVLRSVGLASKSFFLPLTTIPYALVSYKGVYQPTYFLMDINGNLVAKLAYSNGAGYVANQVLPSVTVLDNDFYIGYLIKTLLSPVNKAQGVTAIAGVYAQTGVNLAKLTAETEELGTFEIGTNLHITGGFLWMYDGVKPVEHGFHLWPEDITVTTSGAGGLITAQQYYYYVTYEWTDGQGNIHRSAPSIGMPVTTTGSTSSNTINIPYLRLTYKTAPNQVRICVYRWSTAQQIPYQVTSITSPTLNSTTNDSVAYVDTLADSSILGNAILYTNGGVVENIAAPACSAGTLFRSRLVLLPSENPNNLWYSKQVIQSVPVEMSDLFTVYTAPTISGQASTGPNRVISAMDDKIIIWKKDSLAYVYGNGPDNTGANNDFSDPIVINSTVGSDNQNSVVLIPQGMMFQSSGKGIWLLGRDLSTSYIGAPVDDYNAFRVTSCVSVSGTNQVRFNLENGITLMYDYYYNQWNTFVNIDAVSSTMYNGYQTYINSDGLVRQETPGEYVDGSRGVLVSFTTSWLNLAGLQGFERAYFFYILGKFISPHRLMVQVAYDYNPAVVQQSVITPINSYQTYGSNGYYGGSENYGDGSNVEQWRVFFKKQKCQSFRITVSELYDVDTDADPGEGLTISGLAIVVGTKSGYPKLNTGAKTQIG